MFVITPVFFAPGKEYRFVFCKVKATVLLPFPSELGSFLGPACDRSHISYTLSSFLHKT